MRCNQAKRFTFILVAPTLFALSCYKCRDVLGAMRDWANYIRSFNDWQKPANKSQVLFLQILTFEIIYSVFERIILCTTKRPVIVPRPNTIYNEFY